LVGGASAAVTIPSIAGRVSADTTYNNISFDRVVDAVEDLGMDPTGGQPIDSSFESAIETGTLIEFPPGEYLVKTDHNTHTVSRFGIRGTGDHRNDVQFLPEKGSAVSLFKNGGPGPYMIENISLHERDDEVSMMYLGLGSTRGVYAGDIEFPAPPPTHIPDLTRLCRFSYAPLPLY
jgi:hypothetical protein